MEYTPVVVPFYKQLLLSLVAVMAIILFCHTGIYKKWYEDRARRNFNLFIEQLGTEVSEEQRKEESWGKGYWVAATAVQIFEREHVSNPLLLLEPNSYLSETVGFKLPEPVVFYYFTQGKVKATTMDSKLAEQAQYILYVTAKQVSIQRIKDKQELRAILDKYKNYKNIL